MVEEAEVVGGDEPIIAGGGGRQEQELALPAQEEYTHYWHSTPMGLA